MELDLYYLPDDAFHVSSFNGQDLGVVKLDTVTHVCPVFSHSQFVRKEQPDVPVVLFDPVLNGIPGLTSVHLKSHLQGMLWMPGCSQAKVICVGPKETGDLPRWKAYSFVMFR
jgi:hypothetical protein